MTEDSADHSGVRAGGPIDLASTPPFRLNGLSVRPATREISAQGRGERIAEPRVLQVLVALASADGAVVSRDALIRRCWDGRIVGEDAINRAIAKTRQLADLTTPPAFAIETIPRVGYRLVTGTPSEPVFATAVASRPDRKPAPEATPAPVPSEPAPTRVRTLVARWRWPMLAGVILVLVALAVAGGYWLSPARSEAILLVEPLQVAASDKPAQIVRAGLSGDLARALVGKPAGLAVVQAGDRNLGQQRAQLIVAGDASTLSDALQVHVQLRDVQTQSILWSQNFAGAPGDAEALGEQVADKLGSVLNCALSTRHRGTAAIGDQASILYLKACDLISDYDLDEALDLLRKVTVLAPGFARAWADVGVTQAIIAYGLPPAQRAAADAEAAKAARHALRIDPRTGLAYYALAQAQPGIVNWARRMTLIEKGLAVEPDSSELNNAKGQELLRIGRSREGLVYLKRSMELDPLNPVKTAVLIPPLAFYGDVDAAEALAAKAIALWPQNPMIWNAVFTMEARVGDPRKALAMLQDPHRPTLKADDDVRRWEATLRARLEPTAAHIDSAVGEWVRHAGPRPGGDPLSKAESLAALGRTDVAYRLLAKAAPVEDDADEILFRPDMSAFRADPRFLPLTERRGLVAIWRSLARWPDACSERPPPGACPKDAAGSPSGG